MKKFGFNSKNEFLPSFDKFQSNMNKRLMFLKLFNQQVPCSLKFTKKELNSCKENQLFDIFIKKVFYNLQVNSKYSSKINIDIKKTLLINKFFKKLSLRTELMPTKYSILTNDISSLKKSTDLINILLENDFSFFLDGEESFKNFVSNKILNSSKNREVNIFEDSIDIVSKELMFQTKIFTFWEFINSKKLDIDKHIKKAIDCINKSEFKQVYLVYPKNEKFYKHVSVRCNDVLSSEYEIKLIPYSMRSTLR
ncbi:hypothetical protein [Halarcobacter bivalviorum]|uniref:Uncharacterized protein n=1 Tax=Halarcobacter bivalviorum TaxID=663364 RepID=A0AAX2A607_9BACT|nr:hypothetical protein [Halarcobacter bivalviorum]AXH12901.1 hypothetical protein ABIV_1913 [Halarcobacter bivalviorum]RXK08977.1 hypothetical protein CRV05_11900 [Halarcobacter bivalviorum]